MCEYVKQIPSISSSKFQVKVVQTKTWDEKPEIRVTCSLLVAKVIEVAYTV